jgi:hypothetical protein
MSDTPDDPRRPGTPDPGGRPFPPVGPPGSGPTDPFPSDEDDDDDEVYDLTGRKRRFGGRGRLVAVGVAVLAVAGIGAALVLGGGGDDPESDAGAAGDREAMADAAFEYAECMRENGVDMPDPEVNEDGGVGIAIGDQGGAVSPEDVEAAEEECRPILDEAEPEGGGPQLTPEEVAEQQDRALAMAECMRDRGYDFPDPEVDEHGGIGISFDESNGVPLPGDPGFEDFEQDQQECNDEAGIEGPGGNGGGGRGADARTESGDG